MEKQKIRGYQSHNPFNDDFNVDEQILMQLREYNNRINDIDNFTIHERNKEIKKIEEDMEALAEIQRDLALLVHIQGESIDIAAENVEKTEITVNEATQHIQKASETQKKTNRLFVGGLLTSAGVAVGGGLVAIASPIAGALIAGAGIVSGVIIVVSKVVK
jgi:hypothetical protein